MLPSRAATLFLFLIIISCHLPVYSKDIAIEYRTYQFDPSQNLHSYTKPRVNLKEAKISGDLLVFDKKQNLLTFEGNVVVTASQLMMTAEEARFSLKEDKWSLFKATIYDQKHAVYGKAEQIEQDEKGRYIIHQGRLTSCDPKEKPVEISGSRIVYQVDGFAYSTNAAVWFYSVPIFYTPFISWPTKEGRATGLLPPDLSHHSSSDNTKAYGTRLKIPYFIALDRDHDLTVQADIVEKRGAGIDLEYLYAFQKGMNGRLRFWYLDEQIEDRAIEDENLGSLDPAVDPIDLQPNRYLFEYSHKQDLFWDGHLMVNLLSNSDNETRKEYFDLDIEHDYKQQQMLSLAFPWNNGSVSLYYEQNVKFADTSVFDTSNDEKRHLNRQPAISLKHSFPNILKTPLKVDLAAEWTDYSRQEGWNGKLSKGTVALSSPFFLDFLKVHPFYQREFYDYRVQYQYGVDETENTSINSFPTEFGWSIDTKSLEVSFEVFRLFQHSEQSKKSKLSFVPRIIAKEIEDVPQVFPSEDAAVFGIGSRTMSQKSLVYRLETAYQVRQTPNSATQTLVRLNMTQPVDFNSTNCSESGTPDFCVNNHPGDATTAETEIGQKQLPLRLELILQPTKSFNASLFYRYHHQEKRVVETRISLAATFGEKGFFKLAYVNNPEAYYDYENQYHPVANQYSLSHLLTLSERLKLSLAGTWDQTRNLLSNKYAANPTVERLNRELTSLSTYLEYDHRCYRFRISYSEDIGENTIGSKTVEYLDQTIGFTFSIPFISGSGSSDQTSYPLVKEFDFN